MKTLVARVAASPGEPGRRAGAMGLHGSIWMRLGPRRGRGHHGERPALCLPVRASVRVDVAGLAMGGLGSFRPGPWIHARGPWIGPAPHRYDAGPRVWYGHRGVAPYALRPSFGAHRAGVAHVRGNHR
jgi:hypothetical protein